MMRLLSNRLGEIDHSSTAEWEWKWMRWLFIPIIWLATFQSFNPIEINVPEVAEPGNGFAGFGWLEPLSAPGWTTAAMVLMGGLLICYACNWGMLAVTLGLLLIHSTVGAIYASPPKHHHATQIVGFVLLGQAAFYLLRPLVLKFGGKCSPTPIFWSQQMIAAAYVVSAISKWVNSGGGWIPGLNWVQQVPGIAVQFEKNVMQKYHDLLEWPVGAEANRAAIDFVIAHPGWAKALIGPAFYLEFFAFLALLNRRIGALYGLALIAMHWGISKLMFLEFFHFQAVDLIFLVNIPLWLTVIFRKKAPISSS